MGNSTITSPICELQTYAPKEVGTETLDPKQVLALPNEPAQEGQLEVMVEWTPLSVGTKREAQRASEAAAHRCSRQVALVMSLRFWVLVPRMHGENSIQLLQSIVCAMAKS